MSDKGQPFAIATKSGDIVTKNVYGRYALNSSEDEQEDTKQIPDDRFANKYRNGLVQPLYNPTALANLVEVNPFHQRCVTTKAQDIGGLGYSIRPANSADTSSDDSKKEEIKQFFENQWPTFEDILVKSMTDFEGTGNGYIEAVRDGTGYEGPFAIMNHMPSHTVRVHESKNKYAQVRGNKIRWFKRIGYDKDIHYKTGEEHNPGELTPKERATEVMHFANYTPRSDYYGLPDSISSLGAIQGHLAQRDYNIKFFENFGIPAYAVYITGDYDLGEELPADGEENDKEPEIVQQIRKYLDKVQNEPHSTLVFGIPSASPDGKVKVTFEPLAVETKDAAFRMYRKDNRDEIIVSHGVPPYRVGIAETGSLGGGTAKESTKIYKTSVIAPRQRMVEAFINKYIIRDGFETDAWVFELKTLELKDSQHDKDILEGLFERGGASPNDLVKNLGNEYGIEVDEDNPALNARYLNGTPITELENMPEEILRAFGMQERQGGGMPGGESGGQGEQTMMSQRDNYTEIALKYLKQKLEQY